MNKKHLLTFTIGLWLLSCTANPTPENVISTPQFFTPTLPDTPTTQATSTFVVSSEPVVTLQPIEGITTTQLNVRSEPSTSGETLGAVSAFSTVQVIGKETNGAWYQILYSESANGKGWIVANYVQLNSTEGIPVIQINSGASGIILQGVNVRNGAGKNFDSLGTLVQNDVVSVNGKDSSGSWVQIQYKGNVGWVASEFIRVDLENLSVVEQAVSTESIQEESEANVLSMQDHDSLESPIMSANLNRSEILKMNGFVSLSNGDEADWLQFTTSDTKIAIELKCLENNLTADLYKSNLMIAENFIKCQELKSFTVEPNLIYKIKLRTIAGTLKTVSYSILIKNVN